MKKFISLLLCTAFLAGCGNIDSEKTSGSEKKNKQAFQIGTMENEADLSQCSVHGWCRITDADDTCETTYRGDINDISGLREFIEDLDFSGCEKSNTGTRDEYAVTIRSKEAGFIRISSGMTTVYGYDDLDNATESYEYAITVETGENAQNCTAETYVIPCEVKERFEEIIAAEIVNEDNISNVSILPDRSYQEITDSYPKDLIVLVDGYSNYACGPQNHGRFIDINGYVYEYDMDGRHHTDFLKEAQERIGDENVTYDQAFVDALYYEFYYKNSPVAMVDADTVFDCYMNMCTIDRDADFELINECCDYGQHSLYMVDIESKDNMLLKLRTKGDNTGELDDPAAEKIRKTYDKLYFNLKEIAK